MFIDIDFSEPLKNGSIVKVSTEDVTEMVS